MLYAPTVQTLSERRQARRSSLGSRVDEAARIANASREQCLIWCDLNAESERLARKIDGAVEVRGTDTAERKVTAMQQFASGEIKCMVSKPSIAGWGMNWQQCHHMVFVGLSDSFEAYYQAVRRCWRFGQKQAVTVDIIISEADGAVKANIERKQAEAAALTQELVKYTRNILQEDIRCTQRIQETYQALEAMRLPDWLGGFAA